MSATLHALPATTTMTPEQALQSALALNPSEVLVLGYDHDGKLVVRSSRMSRRDALWLVEQARMHVTQPMLADYAHANLE